MSWQQMLLFFVVGSLLGGLGRVFWQRRQAFDRRLLVLHSGVLESMRVDSEAGRSYQWRLEQFHAKTDGKRAAVVLALWKPVGSWCLMEEFAAPAVRRSFRDEWRGYFDA